jgi:hypothetical protein
MGTLRSMTFDFETGDWLYTDEFGQTWRLKATGEPDMPLIIILEDKGRGTSAPRT